jgi:hypothetical protein
MRQLLIKKWLENTWMKKCDLFQCALAGCHQPQPPEGQQDGLTAETRNHIPVSPNFAGKYSLSQQKSKGLSTQPAKFEQRK